MKGMSQEAIEWGLMAEPKERGTQRPHGGGLRAKNKAGGIGIYRLKRSLYDLPACFMYCCHSNAPGHWFNALLVESWLVVTSAEM